MSESALKWFAWPNFEGGTVNVTDAEAFELLCEALRQHQAVLVKEDEHQFKVRAANIINDGKDKSESDEEAEGECVNEKE